MRKITKVVVIENPRSSKAKKGLVEKFVRQLARVAPKIEIIQHRTEYSGHAQVLAAQYQNERRTVVLSASGDGVYNEVVNGILQGVGRTYPLLGVIPSGNANDHFKAIARGSLVEHIRRGKNRSLDVLRIDFTDAKGQHQSRFAHSYIGFGLTPYVRKQLDEKQVNSFTEKLVAAKSFVDAEPIKIKRLNDELELDNLLFTNITVIAKVFKIKNSQPDDGKYEVHVIEHSTQLHKAGEVLRMNTKKSTATSRSSMYAFTLLEAALMQVDGEVIQLAKNSRVEISLEHRILHTVL